MECYRLLDNSHLLDWKELMSLFYSKFYPIHEIHRDRNYIYNFWPHDGESISQAWDRLKSLMLKCPNHDLSKDIIVNNFYARLSHHDKELLDASLIIDVDKHWQIWRGQIFLCSFSAIPGNGAKKLLDN